MYKVVINGTICINEVDVNSKNRVVGQIKKQVNSIDSLTFTIYPGNAGYDSIEPLNTTVEVYDKNNKTKFRGRVLDVTPGMDESGIVSKSVTCEGAMGYLCDSIWTISKMPYVSVYTFLDNMLLQHNSNVEDKQKIYLGTVESSSSTYTFCSQYGNTLEEINRNLINNDEIGGEIRIRYAEDGKNYLDYADTVFNQGSDTKIELAVNMRSVSQSIDPKEVVTRVYPLGAKLSNDSDERLSIAEKYIDNDKLIAKYGIHAGTVIFDDITSLSDLYVKGHKYADNLKTAKVQYSVSAADLSAIDKSYDEFTVGTTYRIVNPLINLDETLRCIESTIDLNDPTATTLTFGDEFETLTSITSNKISQIQSDLKDMESKENSLIKDVVKNQTALLCGVDGGNIYYRLDAKGKPFEQFFIDTDSLDTATQAIRFNKNGMGFWSKKKDGGSVLEGPYTSAWTIDGTFNTKFIVAQTLTGLKINNGNGTFMVTEDGHVEARSLQIFGGMLRNGTKFSVDADGAVNASAINITGGKIDITTQKETDDIIRLSYGDWTIELSPLQLKLTNDTIKGNVICQAGGIFLCKDNETQIELMAETGDIAIKGEFGVSGKDKSKMYSVGKALDTIFAKLGIGD